MKPYSKILVASDFSANAEEALDTAVDLALRYGAVLALVHVYDRVVYPFPDSSAIAVTMQVARAEEDIKAALEKQRQGAIQRGVKNVNATMLRGDPAGEIVDYARDGGFDVIVMGTHGRRGVSRFLIGSVAERVVRTAPCAVLTVREHEAKG